MPHRDLAGPHARGACEERDRRQRDMVGRVRCQVAHEGMVGGQRLASHGCGPSTAPGAWPGAVSLVARPVPGVLARRRAAGARAQRALHQHDVDPPPELAARIAQHAHVGEAGGGMHADRRGVGRVADHRDHLPVPAVGARGDERVEQASPDPLADRVLRQVDRILGGEAIGRPRAIRSRIGVAQHAARALGDEPRVAAFGDAAHARAHLVDGGRLELEGRRAAQHVGGVDRAHRAGIGEGRVAQPAGVHGSVRRSFATVSGCSGARCAPSRVPTRARGWWRACRAASCPWRGRSRA